MEQEVTAPTECPRGHLSADADYCSECGAKIAGVPVHHGAQAVVQPGVLCPDCGTPQEHPGAVFCEVCGFNFTTGHHGEPGVIPSATPQPMEAQPASEPEVSPVAEATAAAPGGGLQWRAVVAVDTALRGEGSPEAPANFQPVHVDLTQNAHLIGRPDEGRAIFPEIAITWDDAVSRRHALIEVNSHGEAVLRDIGSANGTRLNGVALEPMKNHPLKTGDRVTLGHWTTVVVEAL